MMLIRCRCCLRHAAFADTLLPRRCHAGHVHAAAAGRQRHVEIAAAATATTPLR